MSSDYFTFGPSQQLARVTLAKASSLNALFTSIEAGFAKLPGKDALNLDMVTYYADTGTADALAITMSPAPTAYVEGMRVRVKVNATNTGAATININGLGARTIKQFDGTDVAADDLRAGDLVDMVYVGSNFIIQNPTRSLINRLPDSTPTTAYTRTFLDDVDFTAANETLLLGFANVTKTANYTLTAADRSRHFTYTAAATHTLVAAATAGSNFFHRVTADGATVTITPDGSETINGASSLVLGVGDSALLATDAGAAKWYACVTRARRSVSSISANTTVAVADEGRTYVVTAAATLSLPAAATAGSGFSITVKGKGAAATIAPNGSETIEGASTFVVADGETAVVETDGTSWYVGGTKKLGSAYQVLRVNSGATAVEWGGAGAPDVVLQHQEASGTAGGTATAGSWETRKLNTIVRNAGSLITLNTTTNEFSSTADMWIEWRLSCHSTRWTKTRLYNVTDAVEAALGDSYFLSNSNYDNVFIAGEAAIIAGKNYRLETQVSANRATDGYGFPTSMGTEIYGTVKMWRL